MLEIKSIGKRPDFAQEEGDRPHPSPSGLNIPLILLSNIYRMLEDEIQVNNVENFSSAQLRKKKLPHLKMKKL